MSDDHENETEGEYIDRVLGKLRGDFREFGLDLVLTHAAQMLVTACPERYRKVENEGIRRTAPIVDYVRLREDAKEWVYTHLEEVKK